MLISNLMSIQGFVFGYSFFSFLNMHVFYPGPLISLAPSPASLTCPLGVHRVTENINPRTRKEKEKREWPATAPNEV